MTCFGIATRDVGGTVWGEKMIRIYQDGKRKRFPGTSW